MKNNLIILLCLIVSGISAQQPGNYKWTKKLRPSPTVPEQFADKDAVMVFNEVHRVCKREQTRNYFTETIRKRIKIQKAAGLKYSWLKIPVKEGFKVKTLGVRTLNADGSITYFDTKDARYESWLDEKDFMRQKQVYLVPAPDVDVGDEIDIVVIYRSNVPDMADVYFFHADLPVVEHRFTLELSKDIRLRLKTYNDLPEPDITDTESDKTYFWQQKNLPVVLDETCQNIPADVLPHLVYELNFETDIFLSPPLDNWLDYLRWIHKEDLNTPIRRPARFKALIKGILGEKRRTEQEMTNVFHQFVNEHINLSAISDNEKSRGLEYFLEKRKADKFTLLKLYKAFFETNNIPYFLVIGKDRFQGKFDLEFPTSIQATHLFFAIGREDDIIFVVPKTRNLTFDIDELPIELNGTHVYMTQAKTKKLLYEVEIPLGDSTYHQQVHTTLLKQKSDNNTLFCETSSSYTGAYAIEERHFFQQARLSAGVYENFEKRLRKLQATARLSSVSTQAKDEEQPDLFKVNYDYQLTELMTKKADDTRELSLQKCLLHQLQEIPSACTPGYTPLHPFTQIFNDYLVFDQPVELLNMDNVQFHLSNEVGTYELSIHQPKPTMIHIRSRYVLSAQYIPQENFQQLEQLNEMVRQSAKRVVKWRTKMN